MTIQFRLLAGLAALGACTSLPSASDPAAFTGDWAYRQTCGREHSAGLTLIADTDGRMHGAWHDGTRVRGNDGQLRGEFRDGRLYLQFCRDNRPSSPDICPAFGPESAYVVREGAMLAWYRKFGESSFEKYLSLHRVEAGKPVPADNQCEETRWEGEGPSAAIVLGRHRVRIGENYLRHGFVPIGASIESLELTMRWPAFGPVPRAEQSLIRHGLVGADAIDVTVRSTARRTAQDTAAARAYGVPRLAEALALPASTRARGETLFGLTPLYREFAAPPPLRLAVSSEYDNLDWFFAPTGAAAEAQTFISCPSRRFVDGVAAANGVLTRGAEYNVEVLLECAHTFEWPSAQLVVTARYPRAILADWRAIEDRLRALLRYDPS